MVYVFLYPEIIFGGLKQHQFITLQSCRSVSHWAKIKASTELCSFPEPLGESVSLPFLAARGYLPSLALGLFPPSSKPATLYLSLTVLVLGNFPQRIGEIKFQLH